MRSTAAAVVLGLALLAAPACDDDPTAEPATTTDPASPPPSYPGEPSLPDPGGAPAP